MYSVLWLIVSRWWCRTAHSITIFTKVVWAQKRNLVIILCALNFILIISSHKLPHGTTAYLLFYIQNCDLICSLLFTKEQGIILRKLDYEFVHSLWEMSSSSEDDLIDLIVKSQNAPVPYPTMLHSEQKCTHFCSEWSIVGYGTGAF